MRAVAFTCIAASLAACAKPGRGEHLVHWPQVIAALALDASGIYASVATGQVLRIPLEGGVAEPVAAVADGCLSGNFVLTDTEIILTDTCLGRIVALPKAGGTTRVIAESQGLPWALTRDESNLYWSTVDFPAPQSSVGVIRTAPIEGGPVTTLVATPSAGYSSLTLGGSEIYFGQTNNAAYGAAPADVFLGMVGKDGTGLMHLAHGVVYSSLLLRDRQLFFITLAPLPAARSFDLSSGALAPVRVVDNRVIFGMAGDAAGIFVINSGCDPPPPYSDEQPACSASLHNLLTGEELASANQSAYLGPAIDDRYAYWMIIEDLYRVRR